MTRDTWSRRRFLTSASAAGLAATASGTVAGNPARAAEPPGFQGHIKPFIRQEPPPRAPLAPFTDGAGKPHNMLAFYGEVVVLNFWATWCEPCIWEMPHLDQLQARFQNERFRVLAVSTDVGGYDPVSKFYRRTNIQNLGIYLDQGERLLSSFGWVHGLPITYLLDRKARVVGYMDGPADWISADAQALVSHYLRQA